MPRSVWLLPFVALTAAWLVPVHFLPWLSWHEEVPVFVGVFAAASWALAVHMKTGARANMRLPVFVAGLLAIAALSLLQAAGGMVRYWGDAWITTLYVALCVASFLLGHAAAKSKDEGATYAEVLALTLLIAGVGCTVIAFVQALDVWDSAEWIARTTIRRPGSNLAQPNQMGTMVLMGVVGLVYLFDRERVNAFLAGLLGVTLALGIVTTESRTALLSLATLFCWWWLWRRSESRLRTTVAATVIAFVIAGYVLWPRALMAFHHMDAGTLAAAKVNTQLGFRTIVWPQLLEAVAQHPLFGWGLRQTPKALTTVLDQQQVSEAYPYAHNLVLDLMLGFGIPVTFLMMGAFAAWAWSRRDAARQQAGWFAISLCIPFAVHSMLEFPHTYAYFLAPVLFALGWIDGRFGAESKLQVPPVVAAAAFTSVIALGVWSLHEYALIEEDFRVARFEAGRIGSTPADYKRPTTHLLTQLGALVEGARVAPTRGMPAEKIQLSRDVAHRFPWPALQNRYALSLALNGEPAEAKRILRVIRAMHGEELYSEIRTNWKALAIEKYPELLDPPLP